MLRIGVILVAGLAVSACATRGAPAVQTCADGSTVPVTYPCPPPPPPPPPPPVATMMCPDGNVVQVGTACPLPPPPPPRPTYRRQGERG